MLFKENELSIHFCLNNSVVHLLYPSLAEHDINSVDPEQLASEEAN